jgi:predicted amino acid racemase
MYITNDPKLAKIIFQEGVQRIFVDWEINGKQKRQGHLDTVISRHSYDDAVAIREAVPQAELMIRLNPFYKNTKKEVEQAIEAGANLVMLPMFSTVEEVSRLCDFVDGRAGIVPLFETPESLSIVKEISTLKGIHEIYVGLNDLHLALGMQFMFEPLVKGMLDSVAACAKNAGIRFGFGGIARANEGDVSGAMVLGEHLRLGSDIVILSRTFYRPNESKEEVIFVFKKELKALQETEKKLMSRNKKEVLHDAAVFAQAVEKIVIKKQAKTAC